MTNELRTERLAEGLSWPESLRWHDGRLWVSDVHNFRLVAFNTNGAVESEIPIPQRPSGFDIVEPNRIILATGLTKQLLHVDLATAGIQVAANLEQFVSGALNDLVVAATGWTFVGDTGFLFGKDEPVCCGKIIAYHPERGVKVVADEVFFPNGMVISPDGKSLYVNETFGKRISVFDLGENASLENRRVFAELPGNPDGLALDAEGSLWVPLLFDDKFVKVDRRGTLIDEVLFAGRRAISCMIGGPERTDLFMGVAALNTDDPDNHVRHGSIHQLRLDVPGAGRP